MNLAENFGRVLVTGATGCLGSNLVRQLVANGCQVVILRRPNDDFRNLAGITGQVEHRLGDVRDAASVRTAMQGIDRVFHLAGISIPLNSMRREMHEVNVMGTKNILEAALREKVARVVFTSSSSAIGFGPDLVPVDENFPYNGHLYPFVYGHTKHAAEQIALTYAALGLEVVVVNPTGVMAPGGNAKYNWCGLVLRVLRTRKYLPVPSGGVGIVTLRDMVQGHVAAMQRGQPGERYLLNSINLSYHELARQISAAVQHPVQIKIVPPWLVHSLGTVGSLFNAIHTGWEPVPGLTRATSKLSARYLYYDNTKAVRSLGLTTTSLAEAIKEIHAAWTQSQSNGPIRGLGNRRSFHLSYRGKG